MRTSNKKIRHMKITLVMRTLFACLLVTLLSLNAVPTWAVDAEADAKQALAEWKAAVAAVGDAKKAAKAAEEKKGIALANFKSGGITAAEQKILDNLLAEEAKANAALEAAMERLFAAREALENALNALPDSDLKKELKRQRDGLILDDPNARGESRKGKNPSQLAPQTGQTQTSGGLHVATFNTENGRVIVRLPDDMMAGDTISGTVISEPNGSTEEERTRNRNVLNGYAVQIQGQNFPVDKGAIGPFVVRRAQTPSGSGTPPPPLDSFFDVFVAVDLSSSPLGHVGIPLLPSGAVITPDPKITQPTHPSGAVITPDPKITQPTHPSGAIITPDPKMTNPPFSFPPVGQTGRPIVLTGPFDGNAANTGLRIGSWEDRDSMGRFDVIAESPRKAVFAAPANPIGPITLHLTEGNTRTTGNCRNVGVNLSAPKTNLRKGEQTVLKVEVSGLEGITTPVPLQLDATGVITMDGGNFQNLRITPTEVNQGGTYTTTRAITGQQAGAFTVVATVVVDPYDTCMQDDSVPSIVVLWNTVTGDYIFTCGGQGCSPQPGGSTMGPAGTAGILTVGYSSSLGSAMPPPTFARKGCIITLSHNAPDRRVFARLDTCTKTGDASVQTTSPKSAFTITDKNTADNTCPPN